MTLSDKYIRLIAKVLDVTPDRLRVTRLCYGKAYEADEALEKPIDDFSQGVYTLYLDLNTVVARWRLYQLPHCCAVCVSCKAEVLPDFRGKGLGTLLNNFRQEIARNLGYSLLMCTDVEQNTAQRKLLKCNGWKDVDSVLNRRTGNKVFISTLHI